LATWPYYILSHFSSFIKR